MRRAIWMALAFMGTAPLVALAQQGAGAQAPAGSPGGTPGFQGGQGTAGAGAGAGTAGAGGQQSAGNPGTSQGQSATGGTGASGMGNQSGTGGTGASGMGNQTGMNGVPLQQNTGLGNQGLTGTGGSGGADATGGAAMGGTTGGTGGAGTGGAGGTSGAGGTGGTGGAGMGGTAGSTYRGTTPEMPSASPPVDVGTQVGPEPGEQAGSGGTGTLGTGGAGGSTSGGGSGAGGGGGGQAAVQQAPASAGPEAMQRELVNLRQRVTHLEREVNELRGGTGGGGTGGGGTSGTETDAAANVEVQGPVTVATAVFDGRVVDVSARHIDIVDTSDGTFYRLAIDAQTQAFTGPQLNRIPVERISEGTPVRTSFALISGVEHARSIVTQPQRQQPRQQQGSSQGQQRAPTR